MVYGWRKEPHGEAFIYYEYVFRCDCSRGRALYCTGIPLWNNQKHKSLYAAKSKSYRVDLILQNRKPVPIVKE